MDYEKKYKEALERAKELNNRENSSILLLGKGLEYIFPELQESEDERIRKALIENFKFFGGERLETSKWGRDDDLLVTDILAWLEKQGEEARNIALRTEYEKGKADAIAEMQKEQTQEYLKGADRVQIYEELTKFEKGFDRVADTYAHRKNKDGYNKPWYTKKRAAEMLYWAKEELSLLDKQKPADKVEPKFKVGDFLVNDYCMGKVIELTNDAYLLDTGQGIPFSCEHNVHLWTIEDAKDGDVLCCESGWTCIFKALNSDISFSSYCFMDNTGWFCETGSESHTLEKAFTQAYNGNIHPATKAQRDTLEKAMADAGYTFDFKKKELKKIEQKPA